MEGYKNSQYYDSDVDKKEELEKHLSKIEPNDSYRKINEVGENIDDDNLLEEFFEKAYEKMEEPEEELEKHEGLDWWECQKCGNKFEWKKGKIPLECERDQGGCGKDADKTKFEALTGAYQFIDRDGRKKLNRMKLGERILEESYFFTRKDSEEIFQYQDYCYRPEGKQYIKKRAQELLYNETKRRWKNEIVDYIKDETWVDWEEVDKEDNLIAVKNGLLNTTERELIEDPDPEEHLVTTQINAYYDPAAEFEGSKVEKFLKEIFYEDDLPTIKRFLGTVFLKNYDFKKALVLYGSSNSGKSTALHLFKKLIGKENISNQTLQRIVDYPFSKANLMGKLANIRSDLNTKEVKDPGIFKELTGGDQINAAQKHIQGDKRFVNFAKLMFSCNRLPKIRVGELTEAFWNRWLIVKVDKNIFKISDNETKSRKELMEELTEEKELSALLNWALEGLQEVLEEGHFKPSERTLEGKETWIAHTDNLRAFVNRYTVKDPDGRIVKQEFYNKYTDYCEKKGWTAEDKREVGKQLPKIKGSVSSKKPKIHYGESHKQVNCWEGIRFKEDSPYSDLNRSISDPRAPEEESMSEDQLTISETKRS